MENHWESTRTPLSLSLSLSLSLNLFLFNTPTWLIWYLIQATRMCEGPNKNRHTKHCHCTPLSHTGSPADGPRWVLSSLLLGRIVAAPLISSHYTGGKKKKSKEVRVNRWQWEPWRRHAATIYWEGGATTGSGQFTDLLPSASTTKKKVQNYPTIFSPMCWFHSLRAGDGSLSCLKPPLSLQNRHPHTVWLHFSM